MENPIVPETQTAQNAEPAVPATAPLATPAPEPQVPLAAPAESAPAATPTPEAQPQTTEDKGSEPEEPLKVVEELKRVRKRAQQAEQEAAVAKAQLEEARRTQPAQPTTPQPKPATATDKAPDINDYPDYADYIKASVMYDLRQEDKVKKQAEEQEKVKNRQAEVDRKFYTRVNKVVEKLSDYQDVIRTANLSLQTPVLEAIKESEVGPEIAYYLAKNPSVVEKIAEMVSISSAVREIGKIEAKLSETPAPTPKQTKQVTQAPEPIKPTGGNAAPTKKSYEEMSPEEFMKQRNAETFRKVGNRLVPIRN
jgi:hypothetical protein